MDIAVRLFIIISPMVIGALFIKMGNFPLVEEIVYSLFFVVWLGNFCLYP